MKYVPYRRSHTLRRTPPKRNAALIGQLGLRRGVAGISISHGESATCAAAAAVVVAAAVAFC